MRNLCFSFLLCFFCFSHSLLADEIIWKLNLVRTSDKVDVFLLSDEPEITFDGENIFFKTENIVTSCPFKDLKSFFFEKNIVHTETSIDQININNREFSFLNSETIVYKGCDSLPDVIVSNISGSVIMTNIDYTDSILTISLKNQPSGIYIVNIGGQTIKVRK